MCVVYEGPGLLLLRPEAKRLLNVTKKTIYVFGMPVGDAGDNAQRQNNEVKMGI